MADGIVINDTTYAGEVAAAFITKAMTDFETVKGGHVYIKDGIKKKFTIPRIKVENLIQDRQATPNSQGQADIDGQTLDPQDYMIYMEFNPRDFEDHWYATQLDDTLLDRSLPTTVESVLIQEVLKFHAEYLETALWQAAIAGAAPYDKWDGFITKAIASGDMIKTALADYAVLTAANIVSKFDKVNLLIPNALKRKPNYKFFISPASAELYALAQKNQANKGVDFTSGGVMKYNGYDVIELPGFPDNTILFAKGTASVDSNLWMGVNSKSDENNIQIAKLQANSELYFIKGLFKVDVNFGWDQECVLYHATNP